VRLKRRSKFPCRPSFVRAPVPDTIQFLHQKKGALKKGNTPKRTEFVGRSGVLKHSRMANSPASALRATAVFHHGELGSHTCNTLWPRERDPFSPMSLLLEKISEFSCVTQYTDQPQTRYEHIPVNPRGDSRPGSGDSAASLGPGPPAHRHLPRPSRCLSARPICYRSIGRLVCNLRLGPCFLLDMRTPWFP